MSDTPLDRGLDTKFSVRLPTFLDEHIETFMDDYNDHLEASGLTGEDLDRFTLDSKSEATRRLVDIGLAYTSTEGFPQGFAFDPDDYSERDVSEVICQGCAEDDPQRLRVKGADFETLVCLSCGYEGDVDLAVFSPLF